MAEDQQKKSGGTGDFVARTAGGQAGKIVGQAAIKAAGIASGAATAGIGFVASEIGSRVATLINKNKGKVAAGLGGIAAAPFAIGAMLVSALAAGATALGAGVLIAIISIPVVVAFVFLI